MLPFSASVSMSLLPRCRPARVRALAASLLVSLLTACGGGGGDPAPANLPPEGPTYPSSLVPPGDTRSMRMGFSQWPVNDDVASVGWTWQALRAHADLVSLHLEEGVPWPQALSGTAFPTEFSQRLSAHRTQAAGKAVLLQVTPINLSRDGLAGQRGETATNVPLPAPWAGRAFNHPDVKAAYLAYVRRMATALQPDYLQIGVEVNELRQKAPAQWAAYVELQCATYQALKADNPSRPVFVSVSAIAFFPEYTTDFDLTTQQAALNDLAPCTDFAAITVYPYLSGLYASGVPDGYFDTLFSRFPAAYAAKPRAISEAGFPAEAFTYAGVTWQGTAGKQMSFVAELLKAADRQDMRFAVWYAVGDYDQLWEGSLARSDLALLWRDIGLYDGARQPREALGVWDAWLGRRYAPAAYP